MFVRTTERRYKGQTYTNYVLVESVRTPKGPRQKVVCSLGDLSPRPRAQWLELARKVEAALGGQPELVAADDAEVAKVVERVRRGRPVGSAATAADLISVHADRIRTEEHRTAGPVHVGVQYWRKLGLDEILAQHRVERARPYPDAGDDDEPLDPPLLRTRHARLDPAHARWPTSSAVDFRRLRDQALYRQLDRLHPQRAAIEAALAERERTLFNCDNTVFLYDLTSTYFEGQARRTPKAQARVLARSPPGLQAGGGGAGASMGRGFRWRTRFSRAMCRIAPRCRRCWTSSTRGCRCSRGKRWWWIGAWRTTRTWPKSARASCTTWWRPASPSASAGWRSSKARGLRR